MHFLFGAEGARDSKPRSLNLFKLYRHHHTRPIESLRDHAKKSHQAKTSVISCGSNFIVEIRDVLKKIKTQITDVSTVFFFVLLVIKII
jgi:hypothetical protein